VRFLLVVLGLTSRLLRRAIPRIWVLLSAICPKVSLCFPSSCKVGLLNAKMVILRIWALLSAFCHKVSLFFASSFKVDL